MEINILSEDKDVIVCVKPPGVLSQCDGQEDMPAILRARFGGDIYPVHRLDRNAGGVMAFARNARAAASLSSQMQNGQFVKRYLAVVAGIPRPGEGEMTDLLFRDSRSGRSFVVTRPRKGTREARLSYRTIDAADGRSLVLIRLYTGRTHQIRVQFASRGMPLLGDGKYGSRDKGCGMALWSYRLDFMHPTAPGVAVGCCYLPDGGEYPWRLFDLDSLRESG